MTDIVERLRACHGIQSGDPECCCAEAAAEIECLEADVASLMAERRMWIDDIKRLMDRHHEELEEHNDTMRELGELRAEIERLKAALQPFALNVKAVSLRDALGHISREDLLRARAALEPKP